MKIHVWPALVWALFIGSIGSPVSASTILIPSGVKDSKVEAANRQLVLDFWREFFNEMKTESWPKYLASDFVNHDPYEPSGGQAFADYIKGNNAKFNRKAGPEKERLFVMADGDLVLIVYPGNNKEDVTENVHGNIVRVRDGRITDWWLVGSSGRPAEAPKPYANNKQGVQPIGVNK